MEKNSAKKRIDELVEILNYHAHLYYVEDRNEISDYEYDMLQRELKQLETQFPDLIRKDSPTQRVGGAPVSIFEKVTHKVQMGSLQDVFSFEEVRSFVDTSAAEKDVYCQDIYYGDYSETVTVTVN